MNKSESKYYNTAVRMDKAFLELLNEKNFDYITVKEICKRACVNRSTFYLHYETIADLLAECIDYANKKCFERYSKNVALTKERIKSVDLDELIFITPEYLTPYLEFVKENKCLFIATLDHPTIMNAEATFEKMFKNIFSPILDRFYVCDDEKHYVISFYVSGLVSIVSEWLKSDCVESIETIIKICMRCILPNG